MHNICHRNAHSLLLIPSWTLLLSVKFHVQRSVMVITGAIRRKNISYHLFAINKRGVPRFGAFVLLKWEWFVSRTFQRRHWKLEDMKLLVSRLRQWSNASLNKMKALNVFSEIVRCDRTIIKFVNYIFSYPNKKVIHLLRISSNKYIKWF